MSFKAIWGRFNEIRASYVQKQSSARISLKRPQIVSKLIANAVTSSLRVEMRETGTKFKKCPSVHCCRNIANGVRLEREKMKLDDSALRVLRPAKVFRENSDRVNHISFSPNGDTLITSSEDDSIVIYDCQEGKPRRTLYSKKYGVAQIQYTHALNTVIHTSTKVDDTIRYLSLHDNKYLRYFPGHTKRVMTLHMSPTDDTFISGSLDKTLRLWDLRSPNCQGLMHVNGRPVSAFDPEGLIFAAGVDSEMIKLYDLRSFDKGPFSTFHIQNDPTIEWTGIKFSCDGKMILLSTSGGTIHLIDAFQGTQLHTFKGHTPPKGVQVDVSFTPDSQYVISGSQDGRVHVWASDSGQKIVTLEGNHPGPTQCVKFNPKYMMMASACTNMALWLPNLEDLEKKSA